MFIAAKAEKELVTGAPSRYEQDTYHFNRLLEFSTEHRTQFINITDEVKRIVRQSGIQTGTVHVQSLHTTLGLFIGEWQDALLQDVECLLKMTVPDAQAWRHNDPSVSDCDRGNAVSHLRAMLLGQTAELQVQGGELFTGTWQRVILVECDGPRTRQVSVLVKGERLA